MSNQIFWCWYNDFYRQGYENDDRIWIWCDKYILNIYLSKYVGETYDGRRLADKKWCWRNLRTNHSRYENHW